MRTNPAYTKLAYDKAIVAELLDVLRTYYTPAYGGEPSRKIVSEDVLRDDSEVPQDAIEDYIGELEQREAELELELNRFECVRRDEDAGTQKGNNKAARKTSSRGKRTTKRRSSKAQGRQASNEE